MEFDWDPRKAVINLRQHGVDFADAGTVLHDEQAITIHDEGSDDEDRFVTLGMDALQTLGGFSCSSTHGARIVHDLSRRERRRRAKDVNTRVSDEEAVRL